MRSLEPFDQHGHGLLRVGPDSSQHGGPGNAHIGIWILERGNQGGHGCRPNPHPSLCCSVARESPILDSLNQRGHGLFRRWSDPFERICGGAANMRIRILERGDKRGKGSFASDPIQPSDPAELRTCASGSLSAAISAGTASLAAGPIPLNAYAAELRTSASGSLSAAISAGTASFASGPICPKAEAAEVRTLT